MARAFVKASAGALRGPIATSAFQECIVPPRRLADIEDRSISPLNAPASHVELRLDCLSKFEARCASGKQQQTVKRIYKDLYDRISQIDLSQRPPSALMGFLFYSGCPDTGHASSPDFLDASCAGRRSASLEILRNGAGERCYPRAAGSGRAVWFDGPRLTCSRLSACA